MLCCSGIYVNIANHKIYNTHAWPALSFHSLRLTPSTLGPCPYSSTATAASLLEGALRGSRDVLKMCGWCVQCKRECVCVHVCACATYIAGKNLFLPPGRYIKYAPNSLYKFYSGHSSMYLSYR